MKNGPGEKNRGEEHIKEVAPSPLPETLLSKLI